MIRKWFQNSDSQILIFILLLESIVLRKLRYFIRIHLLLKWISKITVHYNWKVREEFFFLYASQDEELGLQLTGIILFGKRLTILFAETLIWSLCNLCQKPNLELIAYLSCSLIWSCNQHLEMHPLSAWKRDRTMPSTCNVLIEREREMEVI